MNSFIIYLIESSICLAIFYLLFHFFLRKDTSFISNRFYLVGTLIFSLIIPLLNFQISTTNQTIQYIQTQPHRVIESVIYQLVVNDFKENEIKSTIDPESKTNLADDEPYISEKISLLNIFVGIYLIGVSISLILFILNLFRLFKLVQGNQVLDEKKYRLVEIESNASPFSFLNYIFINRHNYSGSEFDGIIYHERIHISQLHSIDILLTELICIFHWFNPFVYLYKRSIKETHEFIVDRRVIDSGHDRVNYLKLLSSEVLKNQLVSLSNSFNSSLTKRRLMMMISKTSKISAIIKWAVISPLLILLIFYFSIGLTTSAFSDNVQSAIVQDNKNNDTGHWWSSIVQRLNIDTTRTKHTPDDSLIVAFSDYSKINSDKSIISNATMLVNEDNNLVSVIESPLIFHFRDNNIIHAFDARVNKYHSEQESSIPLNTWFGEKVVIHKGSGGKSIVEPFPYTVSQNEDIMLRSEGNYAALTDDETLNFDLPIREGRIFTRFGNYIHPIFKKERHHDGIKIAARMGAQIFTSEDGVVESAGFHGGYGNHIVIRHINGYRTSYGHLDKIFVNWGQDVKRGECIGSVGNTGIATASHLYFEIMNEDEPQDPERYIDFSMLKVDDLQNIIGNSRFEKTITISINADTSIILNDELVKFDDLELKLKELGVDRNNTMLMFSSYILTHMDVYYKVLKIYKKVQGDLK